MSRVGFAVETVKHWDENQAEALLDWLALRENRAALQQRSDEEIEVGLEQLKREGKTSGDQMYAELRERSRPRSSLRKSSAA